jgi:hypothetical protein
MNHAPTFDKHDVPSAPVKVQPTTEQDYWAQQFARAFGGTARRKVQRAYLRAQAAKVRKANRRRFRDWRAGRDAAGTVRQQLRVLDGEIGTPAQQALMVRHFAQVAQRVELTVDEVLAKSRAALADA